MRARVPASSANLGPGFDTLGLALSVYTEVTVAPADALTVAVRGAGESVPVGPDHLAVRIVSDVLGHTKVHITIDSDIPLGRGLGSSASLSVAVAAAAGHPDPLRYAAILEGHADNAAAATLGGLVTAAIVEDRVHAYRLPLDPELAFVVLVPDRHLSTSAARRALPNSVPRADAAANLASMGLLLAGLADHTKLVPDAGRDTLHQPYRTALFPESVGLLHALREAGALVSCWSGAGPTLLGICRAADAESIRAAGAKALSDHGVAGSAMVLAPDLDGLQLSED